MTVNNATFKRLTAIDSLRTANIDLNEWKALGSELTDPECVEIETIPSYYKALDKYTEKRQEAMVAYRKAELDYHMELDT